MLAKQIRPFVTENDYLEKYYRLNEEGLWHLTLYEKGDSVQFSCIDYTLRMDDIYAGLLNPFHPV